MRRLFSCIDNFIQKSAFSGVATMWKKFLIGLAAFFFGQGITLADIAYNPNANIYFGSGQKIDFNNDSVIDLGTEFSSLTTNGIPSVTHTSHYFTPRNYLGLQTNPLQLLFEYYSGRVLQGSVESGNQFASSLAPGMMIGPTSPNGSVWSGSDEDVLVLGYVSTGGVETSQTPVAQAPEYVGFQFAIGSETHYGWMLIDRTRFTAEPEGAFGLTVQSNPQILSWAYETNPNTAITIAAIPEPTSCCLVILASVVGAIGVRRRINRNATKTCS
jgi:hypothetical protein